MLQRTHLPFALLASAVTHAALLLVLSPAMSLTFTEISSNSLNIILITPDQSPPKSDVRSSKSALHKASTVTENAKSFATTTTDISSPAADANHVAHDTAGHEQEVATITAHTLQSLLHNALTAHFQYPSLARQSGWQGEVRLGLRIEPGGKIENIHIITSSGYGILDRAAMRSLTAVGNLPHAAELLQGNSLNLILPVRYQLLDS